MFKKVHYFQLNALICRSMVVAILALTPIQSLAEEETHEILTIETELNLPQEPHAKLTLQVAETEKSSLRLLKSAFKKFTSAKVKTIDTKNWKNSEVVRGTVFAFLQTSVMAYSLFVISDIPDMTASISTAVGGIINLYYGVDPDRWDRVMGRGRYVTNKIFVATGVANTFENQKWFNRTTKALTSLFASMGFSAIFSAAFQWNNLIEGFLSIESMKTVLERGSLAFLISFPLDLVFNEWIEGGHRLFSRGQVNLLKRIKNLVVSAITPLVYAGWAPAADIAGILSLTGAVLLIENSDLNLKEMFKLQLSKINFVQNRLCSQLF